MQETEHSLNVAGPLTTDLIYLLREMQAWHQIRDYHTFPGLEDHAVDKAMVHFADPCANIGSIRLVNSATIYGFIRRQDPSLMNLTVMVEGEYLGFLAQDETDVMIACGITNLAQDGKTVLRVKGRGEKVFSSINLFAMNNPLIKLSNLMSMINHQPEHRLGSIGDDIECSVDLSDELTLQTYATIRSQTRMNRRPTSVHHTLEAIHRLTTSSRLGACLVPVNDSERRIAAFLLDNEAVEPLMCLLEAGGGASELLIAGSSPQVVDELNQALRRNLAEIHARVNRRFR